MLASWRQSGDTIVFLVSISKCNLSIQSFVMSFFIRFSLFRINWL